MPDTLNKQSLVNLLIDSPLREPIKINLIDIVNNTTDPDLPKVFPTIVKELEIFQKATERRMKLAEETIAKLGGTTATPPQSDSSPSMPTPQPDPGLSVPPLDLPPLPTAPAPEPPLSTLETTMPEPATAPSTIEAAPPLPPAMPESTPLTTPSPLGESSPPSGGDEAALAEIQKELDSLKTSSADEITAAAAPAPAAAPQA